MFYDPYYDTQPQQNGEPPAQEAPMQYFTPEMLQYMQQYQQQFQPQQFPQEYPQNYPQCFEGFYG